MESHTSCLTPASGTAPTGIVSPHLTVGHLPSPALQQLPQIRDPEWLKVEVCREFQRGMCKRTEECRYAHPEKHIQILDGKVTACYDALKGRCSRETCKYLHPTPLLKQHLEFNGRQTLLHNRAMLQQMLPLQPSVMQAASLPPGSLIGYEPIPGGQGQQLTNLHAAVATGAGSAYGMLPSTDLTALNPHLIPYYPFTATTPARLTFAQHAAATQQVAAMLPSAGGLRADKLEVCRDFLRGNCTRGEFECRFGHPTDRSMIDPTDNTVTVCMDCIKGRCTREKCKYFHPPPHLQMKIRAAQNPAAAATILPSYTPTAIGSPTVMMSNGTALGQPPLKRHAMESSIITSSASLGTSPTLAASATPTANPALATLYGYNTALCSVPQAMHSTPTAYYQQAVPMLQLYGGVGGAITNPATTPSTQLTAFNLPNTSSNAANGTAASYAFLNGQNQIMLK